MTGKHLTPGDGIDGNDYTEELFACPSCGNEAIRRAFDNGYVTAMCKRGCDLHALDAIPAEGSARAG